MKRNTEIEQGEQNIEELLPFLDDPELDQNLDEIPDDRFFDNLAEDYPEDAQKKLSSFLIEMIDEDIEARKDWLEAANKVKGYMGFNIEDPESVPFKQACRTHDSTLATAVVRFYSVAMPELFPATGPVGYKINGQSDEALEKRGKVNANWLNYALTILDPGYYPDCQKHLLYTGFYGTCVKKIFIDEISNFPISRFIPPEDFIIDADCSSVLESGRLTHVLRLSKREIALKLQNGVYQDVDLPYLKGMDFEGDDDGDEAEQDSSKRDGLDLSVYSKRTLFPIYEIHTYLNLEDFIKQSSNEENEIPLPFIVIIDKTTKEILSIRRNWKESDLNQERINYFVPYNYLPGFGPYGMGLAHLLGDNAITLTNILRQTVDAGTFQNLPGGLRAKGMKQQNNSMIIGPGEWQEVDVGDRPIKESLLPLPYLGPSQALIELMGRISENSQNLASTSELGMLDSKEDIPTGTMLAALESHNRIQSAVMRSIHGSLSYEIRLLNDLFKDTLEYEEFVFDGEREAISGEDFIDEVKVIPTSDPSNNSTMHKVIKAQELMRVAEQAPDMHDMHEVYKINYEAQGLSQAEIDKVLPSKEEEPEIVPLDPVTENINILSGVGVKAAIWQDHAAHKIVHGKFAQEQPELQAEIMAHITEHEAYEYLIKMQQVLGQEMPPLEEIENPEVQNQIALAAARGLEEQGQQADQQDNQPIDPNELLALDIQQKAAESEARERIAQLKAETDIFKAQLDFEKEKAKIESSEDIAKLKAETDVEKAEINYAKEEEKIESDKEIAAMNNQTEIINTQIKETNNGL